MRVLEMRRNRDQHAQTLRDTAQAKAGTDHSNYHRIISRRNWSRSELQINQKPDPNADHHEAQESDHISEDSGVDGLPPIGLACHRLRAQPV